jgi:hypothetical protein
MRWLAAIPVAAAGIDCSAPDDVPGLEDSRDTDATPANAANDTPLADTPGYSNGLGEQRPETIARTPLKGTNASHADRDSPARTLDWSRSRPQTDGGPSEPDTLLDSASGRSVNSFPRRFLRSLSTHTGQRHTVFHVYHSDYNNQHLAIHPTPKSTPRELVLTIPQNWYRFNPLLTTRKLGIAW